MGEEELVEAAQAGRRRAGCQPGRDLEEFAVAGDDGVPAKRADEGGEVPRVVDFLAAHALPGLAVEDLGVELDCPHYLERVPLGVVVRAGEGDLSAVR